MIQKLKEAEITEQDSLLLVSQGVFIDLSFPFLKDLLNLSFRTEMRSTSSLDLANLLFPSL
ncbi:hypothetical protein YC2023_079342 [Brassica napus]